MYEVYVLNKNRRTIGKCKGLEERQSISNINTCNSFKNQNGKGHMKRLRGSQKS